MIATPFHVLETPCQYNKISIRCLKNTKVFCNHVFLDMCGHTKYPFVSETVCFCSIKDKYNAVVCFMSLCSNQPIMFMI